MGNWTHTPGPWKFGKELAARSGEWLISFDAGDKGRGIEIAETRPASGREAANARLIAAAPKLLEALKGALKALDAIGDEMTVGERYTNAGQYLIDALTPARAAIREATGEAASDHQEQPGTGRKGEA